jgi:anti-anti-sigma factor
VVDVGQLQFIDMAGLRVLRTGHDLARRDSKRLVLVHVGPSLRRVLEMVRVSDVLTIADGDTEPPPDA